MRDTMGEDVLWSILGLLFSVAGMIVPDTVGSRAFTGSMEGTLETVANDYLPLAVASLLLRFCRNCSSELDG